MNWIKNKYLWICRENCTFVPIQSEFELEKWRIITNHLNLS